MAEFEPRAFLTNLARPYLTLQPRRRDHFLRLLGKRLACKIDRGNRPFSPKYLRNVVTGHQPAGAPLISALQALWIGLEAGCPIAGEFSQIEAHGRSDVEPGAMILAASRRCRGCDAPFVPKVPNQKWCSKECRQRSKR
jgi:hypothetical protein